MQQPQSDDEIQLVERELRVLDSELRILWNPTARFRESAYYDAEGKVIRNTEHEGRWQVSKRGRDGETTIVYTLESDGDDGTAHGSYRPVGEWLVEFMRKWDSANAAFRGEWEKEWAGHDALVKQSEVWQDDAAALEGLEKMYLKMAEGHTRYPGRGADFK